MAIYVPPTNFAPAIQGFGMLAQHLMNPDKKYVDALRLALQEGRIDPKELNNMTPEEISNKYNIKLDNAKQFTTNKPDSKTLTDRYTATELQQIYANPNDPRRAELIARITGTQTPTERATNVAKSTGAVNAAKLSDMEVTQLQQDLQSTDPKVVEATKARLSGRGTKDQLTTEGNQATITGNQASASNINTQDMLAARVSNAQLLANIGGEKNLYSAYLNNRISPDQRAAINNDKDLSKVFDSQQDDYWKQKELDFRNRSLGNKPEDIFLHKAADMATKYGEYSGKSNPKDIFTVMQSPTLQAKYTDMDAKDVQPGEQQMWEAAQAIKIAKDKIAKSGIRQDMNDKLSVERAFQSAVGRDITTLSDPTLYQKDGVDIKSAQPIVDRINSQAAAYYSDLVASGAMDAKDVPFYKFDKNHPASSRMLADQPVLYQVRGKGVIDNSSNAPNAAQKNNDNDPLVTAAKTGFDQGKFTEADLQKSTSLTPDEKAAIQSYIDGKKKPEAKK